MAIIRSHNLTSHTYDPALAEEIAQLMQINTARNRKAKKDKRLFNTPSK